MNRPPALIIAWALLSARPGCLSGAQPATAANEGGAAAFDVPHVTGEVWLMVRKASRDASRGDWQSALGTLIECADRMGDDLYRVAPNRFVPARRFLQGQIAALPAPALASYRALVDEQARDWYASGVAAADRRPLEMIVRTAFCSSWGDDALVALGDIAASRGWYAAARQYWIRVYAGIGAPGDTDESLKMQAHGDPFLVYPDSDSEPAALAARMVLAELLAGDQAAAAKHFQRFRHRYSQVQGELAGRRGPLAEIVGQVMDEARAWPPAATETDWTTFGGDPRRQRRVAPADRVPGPVAWRYAVESADGAERDANPTGATATAETSVAPGRPAKPRFHPIVIRDLVLVNDGRQIVALAMNNGQPAFGGSAARIYSAASHGPLRAPHVRPRPPASQATLSAVGARLYALVGASGQLVCLDLSREGKLLWQSAPDVAHGTFEGTPVADEDAIYVGMAVGNYECEHYLLSLDARDGYPRWRTRIGRSAGRRQGRATGNLVTLAEGRLYYNTNEGAVAALSPDDGSLEWLWTHGPDAAPETSPDRPPTGPSPAVFAGDRMLVAPQNDRRVFALAAATGCQKWSAVIDDRPLDILGTTSDTVYVAGTGLWVLDLRTGAVLWRWPDQPAPELRRRGRPVLVGDEVIWPAAGGLYAVRSAGQPDAVDAVRLDLENHFPANLLHAHGHLIIAGAGRIECLPYAPDETMGQRRGAVRGRRYHGGSGAGGRSLSVKSL